jgi:hypothetical protein
MASAAWSASRLISSLSPAVNTRRSPNRIASTPTTRSATMSGMPANACRPASRARCRFSSRSLACTSDRYSGAPDSKTAPTRPCPNGSVLCAALARSISGSRPALPCGLSTSASRSAIQTRAARAPRREIAASEIAAKTSRLSQPEATRIFSLMASSAASGDWVPRAGSAGAAPRPSPERHAETAAASRERNPLRAPSVSGAPRPGGA